MKTVEDVFKEFLNIHWLRPEAAFFKTYDYSILKDIFPLEEPSVDMCCGDGITSYIWAGGEFNLNFDMYQAVSNVDRMFECETDVFNHFNDRVKPDIKKKPNWNFSCGLDLKGNLLDKSKLLNFYDEIIEQDLTKPITTKKRYNSAFSTTIWVGSNETGPIECSLKNVNQILNPNGRFVFRVHERKFRQFMFHNYYEKHGFQWAKRLSRNFNDNNPAEEVDIDWWIAALERNGFKINKVYNYVPRLIIQFYLTGFRPMFKSLIKMYNLLSEKDRIELKKQWIEDLTVIFSEFTDENNCKIVDPDGENILYMIDAQKVNDVM